MKVWCEHCGRIHSMSVSAVERIAYVVATTDEVCLRELHAKSKAELRDVLTGLRGCATKTERTREQVAHG
jgi:hypothetical protein